MKKIKEIDKLIQMVTDFFGMEVKITFTTPEYRLFHNQLTEYIYKYCLEENRDWKIISQNLIYRSNQYMVESEANIILEALERIKRFLLKQEYEPFWKYIHPYIKEVSRVKFDKSEYSDSVEAAFKEINNRLKLIVINKTGNEYDGADLMRRTFSVNTPILQLDDINYQTGKNIQEGYMNMFVGAMIGIRNPKAHTNSVINKDDAVRKLHFASMLMYKIDKALEVKL